MAEVIVTASKVTLIGRNGRPITHPRAPSELLTYPTAPALAARYTITSGRPPRHPGEALIDAATAHSLGYRPGDRIGVLTAAGPQAVTVTGVTGFGGADSPAGALSYTSLDTVIAAAGALAAVAAAAAAGPLLARPAARLIAAPAALGRRPGPRASVTVALAGGNVTRNPYRTAALAGILTAGLAAAVTVSIIAASAQASARNAFSATSHADLYLRCSIGPSLARAVAAQPGVAATMRVDAPLVQVAGTQTRIDGIDPASAALVNFGVRTGSVAALRGDALFVSTVQAARHGWRTGSPVTVNTLPTTAGPGRQPALPLAAGSRRHVLRGHWQGP